MPRKIIHLDLDAFFCAVEEKYNPSLRGRAFAVGGQPEERGVVASCSYPARQHGVRSAMPVSRALRLCAGLLVVPPRHQLYSQESHQVMDLLHQHTPLVEQISIDEAFLDLTDLPEPGEVLARRLQEQIRSELDLPCSIGIASNKLVAKIATDVGKAAGRSANPPCAITAVPAGEEAAFLAPLPAQALWGVGPKTSARLAERDITTIGDLARLPENELTRLFGKNGSEISHHARGIDNRPVVTWRETKSISQETTFAKDIADETRLLHVLAELSEHVGSRLRAERLCGATLRLKIRWPDFTTLTRQVSLAQPTDQDSEIFASIEELFRGVWTKGRKVRLLGVGASGLVSQARQMAFWERDWEKEKRLLKAVDTIKLRYGKQAVHRGKGE